MNLRSRVQVLISTQQLSFFVLGMETGGIDTSGMAETDEMSVHELAPSQKWTRITGFFVFPAFRYACALTIS